MVFETTNTIIIKAHISYHQYNRPLTLGQAFFFQKRILYLSAATQE